jgi:hypothetical protein
MSDFNTDGTADNDWDERGELAWNEFDWERYLQEQDRTLARYLTIYDQLPASPSRLDETARQMGWEEGEWTSDEADTDDEEDDEDAVDSALNTMAPYTLHRNPVFVATVALFLGLRAPAERLAVESRHFPPALAVPYLGALHRSQTFSLLGISALDLGDYALGIAHLKRAMACLNQVMKALPAGSPDEPSVLRQLREHALPRLFDLREIWLRVINECRSELQQGFADADSDEEDEDRE